MKKGDRVQFRSRNATVMETVRVTPGMVDIRLDGESFIRRASVREVAPASHRARRNSSSLFTLFPSGEIIFPSGDHLPISVLIKRLDQIGVDQTELVDELVKLPTSEKRVNRIVEFLAATKEKPKQAAIELAQKGAGVKRAEGVAKRLGRKETLESNIDVALQGGNVTLFTRLDPPRVGSSQNYCGNPIDGTAYYLATWDKRDTIKPFLTWKDVLLFAMREKGFTVSAKKDGKLLSLDEWTRSTGPVREDLIAQILASDGGQEQIVAISQLSQREKLIFLARIYFPAYQESMGRGVDIFEHRESLGKGVRGRAGARKRGGRQSREAAETPLRRAREKTIFADPGTDFYVLQGNQRVFYRISKFTYGSKSKQLDQFQPFQEKRADLPVSLANGANLSAVVAKLFHLPEAVVQLFLASSGIRVQYRTEGGQKRNVVLPSRLPKEFPAGATIILGIAEKARSPFFSWIEAKVAPPQNVGEYPHCLSSEEDETVHLISKVNSLVLFYKHALFNMRRVFHEIIVAEKRVGPRAREQAYLKQLEKQNDRLISAISTVGRAYSAFQMQLMELNWLGESSSASAESKVTTLFKQRGFTFPQSSEEIDETLAHKNASEWFPSLASSTLKELYAEKYPAIGSTFARFLAGVDLHPLESFWSYFSNQQRDQAAKLLSARGINMLRYPLPTGTLTRKVGEEIHEIVRNIQAYGEQTRLLTRSVPVEHPRGWPVSFNEQMDIHWTLGIIFDFYNELVWKEDITAADAGRFTSTFLVAFTLYHRLQGFELVGPWRDGEGKGLLDVLLKELRQESIQLIGGTTKLGDEGEKRKFTTYMTYNPLLFELTRLYWPSTSASDPHWGTVLRHPEMLTDIDAIGRYGIVAERTQNLALRVNKPEQIGMVLAWILNLIEDQTPNEIVKGQFVRGGERIEASGQVQAGYDIIRQCWPIGTPMDQAIEALEQWSDNPLVYLRQLKEGVERAVPKILRVERTGVSKKEQVRPPGVDRTMSLGGRTETALYSRLQAIEAGRAKLLTSIDVAIKMAEKSMKEPTMKGNRR